MGYVASIADCCLFFKPGDSERTAVAVWVDDFVFMHQKEETWTVFLSQLRKKFTINAAGPSQLLGNGYRLQAGSKFNVHLSSQYRGNSVGAG